LAKYRKIDRVAEMKKRARFLKRDREEEQEID
jgi:hypothetical protein